MTFKQLHFHIFQPIFGVTKIYGWEEGVLGIGLLKSRIDELAKLDETIYVGYGKNQEIIYTIKAKKIQSYPVHDIPSYKNAQTYVVKSTDLNKSKMTKNDYEVRELCQNGTFG